MFWWYRDCRHPRCNLLLQFLIRAINKPNLDLFETLIHLIAKYVSMYMSVYEGTLIIQLPRLNWQTKLLQKLGSKLHYYNFGLYKTVYFI